MTPEPGVALRLGLFAAALVMAAAAGFGIGRVTAPDRSAPATAPMTTHGSSGHEPAAHPGP